jgi:regulator-associated protein of mTOR
MNGEVRIWDVRAPEKPLYESVAQSHGLAGLAVHAGAPVLATYVSIPSWVSSMLISRTSAPSHDLRQRLVIQGFSDPTKPKTLSRLSIPLSPNVGGPQRPVGFMPSAASLAFHPVSILVPLSYPGAGNENVKRGS